MQTIPALCFTTETIAAMTARREAGRGAECHIAWWIFNPTDPLSRLSDKARPTDLAFRNHPSTTTSTVSRLSRTTVAAMLELIRPMAGGHIAILDSSFNPPTVAHLAIASSAFPSYPSSPLPSYTSRLLLYSPRNADKVPGSSDASTEQRLAMMSLMAEHMARAGEDTGVALLPLPTFAQKTEEIARRFPDSQLTFLVGTDTLTRIFDTKYYDDMDSTLAQLFERATLVCCARGHEAETAVTVDAIRTWANRGKVRFLEPVGEVSSTQVRRAVQRHDWDSVNTWCAPGVGEYVRKAGLYK